MLIQLADTDPPILLAPIYYCHAAKVSTLSPGAIKIYNGYEYVNLRLLKALEYKKNPHSETHTLPTIVYNNMDYMALPIIHIKNNKTNSTLSPKPSINTIAHQNSNNHFIHQKFDHRNMTMILKMQQHNLMHGITKDITRFHQNYQCPICHIANATKTSTNKTST